MSVLTSATRMWLTRSTKPFQFTDPYENSLPYHDTQQLGLYVHIPFCQTLCSFCPYCKVKYEAKLANDYVDALIQEIHFVAQAQSTKKQVTSLYFGGGSPALVIHRLAEIILAIQAHFEVTEGIGIELHPHDVTVELLQWLKQVGVTKISIGIQSFQDPFLQVLGRAKFDYTTMFQAIQTVNFETVSMDFIFALPNQTFQLIKNDIDLAFANGANHIAIYPFIDFSFAESQVQKMGHREKRQLLADITDYCQEQGYVRDSIWTFSADKQGQYSSMTRDNFLGFGCSATTLLEHQFKINTFSITAYIERINQQKLATSLTLQFTQRQRMIYYLFWTAYTMKISASDFEDFFKVSLTSQYGFELKIAKALGYIKERNGYYEMTAKGAYYYHYYENYYTLSYIDQMWGVMRKEDFPHQLQF